MFLEHGHFALLILTTSRIRVIIFHLLYAAAGRRHLREQNLLASADTARTASFRGAEKNAHAYSRRDEIDIGWRLIANISLS